MPITIFHIIRSGRRRFPDIKAFVIGLVVVLSMLPNGARAQERAGERRAIPVKKGNATITDSTSLTRKDSLERYLLPKGTGTLMYTSSSLLRITPSDMQWNDYRFAGDLIERIPGAMLYTQSGAGQYDQVAFHGADWRSVAILSNGRPLNDPVTGVYNLHHYALEEAEEIEIVGGPDAFMMGLNSTGAAVNLVQKNYQSNTPFSRLRYAEDGYNYQFSDGNVSQNLSRRMNLSLGFQHVNTDGRFTNSYHDSWLIRGKARYSLSPSTVVLLSERFLSAETGLNGGIDEATTPTGLAFVPQQATVVNADSYEKITRHDIDVSLVARPLADSADLSQLSLYYSNCLREYRDEENRTSRNGIFVQDDHRSSWLGLRAQQHVTLPGQVLSLGGSVELRQIEESPTLGRHKNVVTGLWVSSTTSLLSPVQVSLGARMDGYLGQTYTGAGVDLKYRIADGLLLYATGSVSRRLPTYTELFWTDSTVARPAPITAERHRYFAAGARYEPGQNLSLQISAFRRKVEDPIVFSAYNKGRVFPGILIRREPERTYRGVDFSARCQLGFLYVEATAGYLLQDDSTGNVVSNRPKLAALGGVYYWDKLLNEKLELKAGFRGAYTSRGSGPTFNPEIVAYVESPVVTGSWSRVDFVALAHIGDARIHFAWENLTNVRYYGTPYYPGLDRTIRFGIAWDFQN